MLFAKNISCTHAFTTRWGGLSKSPFNELNLGGHDDEQDLILKNRIIALQKLNFTINQLCNLKQVHGNHVCIAKYGQQEGDALVTNEKNKILAISIADCYPILFYDKKNKVIGAAHAGWRGTVNRIAKNTIDKMRELGAEEKYINVAIGQGISQDKFNVGNEVIEEFLQKGFNKNCISENKIDLIKANQQVLMECNIENKNIWIMNKCTFENDFFSYRQDKGKTGRMWALIAL